VKESNKIMISEKKLLQRHDIFNDLLQRSPRGVFENVVDIILFFLRKVLCDFVSEIANDVNDIHAL
jgi:hypothetical protein